MLFFQINFQGIHKLWIHICVRHNESIPSTTHTDELVECLITSKKNSIFSPDHDDNILTYVEREFCVDMYVGKYLYCVIVLLGEWERE